MNLTSPGHLLDNQPIVRRVIGWATIAIACYLVVTQVEDVVHKKTGLPNIRHSIFWSKTLWQQALRNRNPGISHEVATFYLIERELAGDDLTIDPTFGSLQWSFEHVSRTNASVADDLVPQPAAAWKDLQARSTERSMIDTHKVFHVLDPVATSYVLVPTTGDGDPFYLVPDAVYRSRVASSGANLRAP